MSLKKIHVHPSSALLSFLPLSPPTVQGLTRLWSLPNSDLSQPNSYSHGQFHQRQEWNGEYRMGFHIAVSYNLP